jgi:hypothetical protein
MRRSERPDAISVLLAEGFRVWVSAMLNLKYNTFGFVALCAAYIIPADAQQPRYDVQGLNFDLWCQEQAKLPPRRCDRRTALDEKAYNAYRDKIDKFEIPYLQEKKQEDQMDRSIMNSDPVDNPQGSLVSPSQ